MSIIKELKSSIKDIIKSVGYDVEDISFVSSSINLFKTAVEKPQYFNLLLASLRYTSFFS